MEPKLNVVPEENPEGATGTNPSTALAPVKGPGGLIYHPVGSVIISPYGAVTFPSEPGMVEHTEDMAALRKEFLRAYRGKCRAALDRHLPKK